MHTNFKSLRRKAGFRRQDEFAAFINVHPDTVSAWERGEREPQRAAVLLLRLLIGVPGLADELGDAK